MFTPWYIAQMRRILVVTTATLVCALVILLIEL
jgi:hypothetical protein